MYRNKTLSSIIFQIDINLNRCTENNSIPSKNMLECNKTDSIQLSWY